MNLEKIRIENTDIFLDDQGNNKGKITISDTYGYNYSMYWGSMGDTLKDFICRINSEYFADKLMGSKKNNVMDVKKTFTNIRKYIKNELDLPWYKYQEFQKDLREKLNDFQRECEDSNDENFFVNYFFSHFINELNFYLIDDKYDRERYKKDFEGICEHWYFISHKPSNEYLWLMDLHKKLKKELGKN